MSQKPSVALQYTALLTLPDRNMLLMEAEVTYFHPVNYIVTTVDHSLSGVTASKFIDIECACKSCNLEICGMCYAIPGVAVKSRDWNAILRLYKFSDCVEHIC